MERIWHNCNSLIMLSEWLGKETISQRKNQEIMGKWIFWTRSVSLMGSQQWRWILMQSQILWLPFVKNVVFVPLTSRVILCRSWYIIPFKSISVNTYTSHCSMVCLYWWWIIAVFLNIYFSHLQFVLQQIGRVFSDWVDSVWQTLISLLISVWNWEKMFWRIYVWH